MVDLVAAKHHGVCPTCEGYGGNGEPDCSNTECSGSCESCCCPDCKDAGTWEAATDTLFWRQVEQSGADVAAWPDHLKDAFPPSKGAS